MLMSRVKRLAGVAGVEPAAGAALTSVDEDSWSTSHERLRASQRVASSWRPKGSKLVRRVPLKSKASYEARTSQREAKEGSEERSIHLRDDGELLAKVLQAHLGDVESINLDGSRGEVVDDAEEGLHDRTLPSSSSAPKRRGQLGSAKRRESQKATHRPTTPIFSPAPMLSESPLRTGGSSGR